MHLKNTITVLGAHAEGEVGRVITSGVIAPHADCKGGKRRRVSFHNAPSFVMHREASVEVPGLGTVPVDAAYGGMIYAIGHHCADQWSGLAHRRFL